MSSYKGKLGLLKFSDQPMKNRISSATEILARLNTRDECILTKHNICSSTVDLSDNSESDSVEHPDHYQGEGYEVLDIIEDFDLNFNLGNVLKYILRAGKKELSPKEEDLEKALFYLKRELGIE